MHNKVKNRHTDSKKLYPTDLEMALNVKQLQNIAKVLKIEGYYNYAREKINRFDF